MPEIEQAEISPVPPSRQHSILIGPDGLRAGWSLIIYCVILVALATGLRFGSLAVYKYRHGGKTPPAMQAQKNPRAQTAKPEGPGIDILQEGSLLLVILFAAWVMSRIEKRPLGEYGLGGNSRRWPQFAQGFFWGFALISLLILFLYLGHYIVLQGFLLHGFRILKYGVAWLVFFMIVGLFEEFLFRGYIQYTLARGIGFGAIGFWISAALWNFGFGYVHGHNPGESPIGVFLAGFIGFIFCLSLWYTRSLWWAIGFHATWDWGESYFYGTADSGTLAKGHLIGSHPQGSLLMSGGATGPEGSVFAIFVCLLVALVIWLTLRRERGKSTNQALVNPVKLVNETGPAAQPYSSPAS
ncbi:MAG: CPBP family intramembrane glutamic endopeptidase [Acidobacteriaceae bacterium]